jgi:hypothetical protein
MAIALLALGLAGVVHGASGPVSLALMAAVVLCVGSVLLARSDRTHAR